MIQKKSTALERSGKLFLLQGLNKFHSTIPLSSNVEQDT